MTDAENLRAAKAKIEQGWCQGFYAVDARGLKVSPYSKDAARYCIVGALWAVAGEDVGVVNRCCDLLSEAVGLRGVIGWQDAPDRTSEEVLALFGEAIEKADRETTLDELTAQAQEIGMGY